MFKHKLFVLMGLVLLLAVFSGGAATPAPALALEGKPAEAAAAPQEAADTGKIVRIGWAGSPDSLNPGAAVLAESYTIFELVYNAMYDLELDGSYSLDLAESVAVSEDGKSWTFKIRPDVKFHDGQPLTAKDVAFTYNFYHNHADFIYLPAYTEYFEKVEATDDHTVVITLTEPIGNMESQLVFLYILPEHIWSKYDTDKAAEFENLEMIGSGPFKMKEYQQNEFVDLVANKDYFGGVAKVDEVIFQTFANPDALVQAIATGQVDLITEMPLTAVPTLRNNSAVTLVSGTPLSATVRDIIFNQIDAKDCPPDDGKCTGHPALRDPKVRLAMAHATDKQNLIDVAELGFASPGLTLIPDSLGQWYNNSLQDYAFDVAKANQILDEAGYKDADGDGVRDMPDGSRPLSFRLYWANDIVAAPRIAELLGDMWQQIGLKTEPQAFDPDTLTTVCCPAFDFDIMIWGWGSDPDPNALLKVMRTDMIPSGTSETGYANPEYDKLYDQQATTVDQDDRREIVWQMQKMTFDDVVYIIPYYQQAVQAYRNDHFKGWVTEPTVVLEDPTSLMAIEPVQ